MKTVTLLTKENPRKHHHEDDNCRCNKECKNCKADQVFDIEKISLAIEKLQPLDK